MDQSKTPHWIQCSKVDSTLKKCSKYYMKGSLNQMVVNFRFCLSWKGTCNAHFLKMHMTHTLSYRHSLALCFLDLMRWPQDANSTTNALVSTFRHIIYKVRTFLSIIIKKCRSLEFEVV